MKRCPSCSADVEGNIEVCPTCGYQFDESSSRSEKRTMMGLPSIETDDDGSEESAGDMKGTLFGFPAQGGDSDASPDAPVEDEYYDGDDVDVDDYDEDDFAETNIVPPEVLQQQFEEYQDDEDDEEATTPPDAGVSARQEGPGQPVEQQPVEQQKEEEEEANPRATMAGFRLDDDSEEEKTRQAWDLAEDSGSEAKTEVAPSSLLESVDGLPKETGSGFSRPGEVEEEDRQRGTLMGMSVEDIAGEQEGSEEDQSPADERPERHTHFALPAQQADDDAGATSPDPDEYPEESDVEVDDAPTQAWNPSELEKNSLKDKISSADRSKLLEKIRSSSRETAKGAPSADRNTAEQSKPGGGLRLPKLGKPAKGKVPESEPSHGGDKARPEPQQPGRDDHATPVVDAETDVAPKTTPDTGVVSVPDRKKQADQGARSESDRDESQKKRSGSFLGGGTYMVGKGDVPADDTSNPDTSQKKKRGVTLGGISARNQSSSSEPSAETSRMADTSRSPSGPAAPADREDEPDEMAFADTAVASGDVADQFIQSPDAPTDEYEASREKRASAPHRGGHESDEPAGDDVFDGPTDEEIELDSDDENFPASPPTRPDAPAMILGVGDRDAGAESSAPQQRQRQTENRTAGEQPSRANQNPGVSRQTRQGHRQPAQPPSPDQPGTRDVRQSQPMQPAQPSQPSGRAAHAPPDEPAQTPATGPQHAPSPGAEASGGAESSGPQRPFDSSRQPPVSGPMQARPDAMPTHHGAAQKKGAGLQDLVRMLQSVFGVLAGIVLLGAFGLGLIGSGIPSQVLGVLVFAVTAVGGLASIGVTFLPLKGNGRSIAYAICGVLMLFTFALGLIAGLSRPVMIVEFTGAILAMIAAGFPLVNRLLE